MSGVTMVLIAAPDHTITFDWALEFGAAPGHLLAFRDVFHPQFVWIIQSVVYEMDGLFRIQGYAKQEAQQ